MSSKVIWAKIGWADRYQGDPVFGDFDHPQERRAEQFNFLPDEDGNYLGYVGNTSGTPPTSSAPEDWLVIFLARKPGESGMHIVGWYENATLLGGYRDRGDVAYPALATPVPDSERPVYSVVAQKAFLVPSPHRVMPYSHPSIGSARFSYLSGPGITIDENKKSTRPALMGRLKKLRNVAIESPRRSVALEKVDPLLNFGTAEHRRRVEKAAIKAVTTDLRRVGYKVKSHEHLNRGYDLRAVHRKSGATLRVEVKGTASSKRRFFLSANENLYRTKDEWRFAIVTSALKAPVIEMMTLAEFDQEFDLTPLVWIGRDKSEVSA